MRLSNVKILNFKSCRNVELNLGELHAVNGILICTSFGTLKCTTQHLDGKPGCILDLGFSGIVEDPVIL